MGFIHSDQAKLKKSPSQAESKIEQCVNVFRTLQAITDETKVVNVRYSKLDDLTETGLRFRPS